MMRCINQLETVSGGSIEICGETLVKDGVYADKKKLREIGLHSGLVFQNFNLFPHFSVLKNITEAQIHVLKRNKVEAEEVARKLLAKMGLRGKTLTGYFNLNVDDFNKNVFFQKDMSAVKAYEEVPFAVKIRSDRACNNATKLVDSLAEKFELVKNPKFEPVDPIKEIKEKKED